MCVCVCVCVGTKQVGVSAHVCLLLQADRDPEGPVDGERAKTDAQVCGLYSGTSLGRHHRDNCCVFAIGSICIWVASSKFPLCVACKATLTKLSLAV